MSSAARDEPSGITRTSLSEEVAALLGRFTDTIRQAAEPDTRVQALPGWSVTDVTAHLITAVHRYAQGPSGTMEVVADPADLPALNERLLREQTWGPLPQLLVELGECTHALLQQVAGYGDDQPSYEFNGGRALRADEALGVLAAELLVHGNDVAEALGAPWPVRAADVESVLFGLESILPGWVQPRRGGRHTGSYDIRVRGSGIRHTWVFDHGNLDCHADPAGRVDCHLSADPRALLLVMYRRRRPWQAAVTGSVVAWGRRPWTALTLPGRFYPP